MLGCGHHYGEIDFIGNETFSALLSIFTLFAGFAGAYSVVNVLILCA